MHSVLVITINLILYILYVRYGFNSDGHSVVFERLKKLKQHQNFDGIVGVNLGKNKESENAAADYVKGIEKFAPVADYFVINISR